jgi:hypothetical protein
MNDRIVKLSVGRVLAFATLAFVLAPALAFATSYLPGQTLNPSCLPTDSTCIVAALPITTGSILFGNGTATAATSSSLFWDSVNNRLGIGTMTPPQPLTIVSNNASGTAIRISNTSTGGHIFDLLSSGSANTGGAGRFDIFDVTSGLARLSVQSGGNVGIGTASPAYTLDVSGFINTNQSSGYKQAGSTILYASSTDSSLAVGASLAAAWMAATSSLANNTAVGQGALATTPISGAAQGNSAFGSGALNVNTTGAYNVAVGWNALPSNTTGTFNVATGVNAMYDSDVGSNNVATGVNTLFHNSGNENTATGFAAATHNTTSNDNVANGAYALYGNDVGSNNVAVGAYASYNNSPGTSTVAIGYQTAYGNNSGYSNQGGTIVGYEAGHSFINTGSNYNTLLGYQSGYGITTGSNNLLLATATSSTGIANLTTGSQNILIGNNVSLPSATANGQLDIGNVIYGTGIIGTGSTLSAGNVGIGTANPYSRLQVTGPDTASTTAFLVANSASTTEFAVYDTGNATLAGGLIQNSDQRLKTNVQTLDASSSLSLIDRLNPVTFNWIDPNKGATTQLGFIAQQVLPIFPNLVATTSPTALTPDGTLSLNYIDLVSPIVSAIQALSADVSSIENAITGFGDSFTTNQLTFVRGQGNEIDVQKLCIGSTCVTEDQLKAILSSANQSPASGSTSSSDSSATSSEVNTPPVISINGNNPAIVQVNATYNDLGATITGPQADLNLGITTFLNGTLTSNIAIDTSAAATDTIDYVATDSGGLAATSTRIVIVEAASSSPSIQ